jgi:hypothetical protein
LRGQAADRIAVDGHRSEGFRTIIANVFVKLNGAGDPCRGTNLPAGQTYSPILMNRPAFDANAVNFVGG